MKLKNFYQNLKLFRKEKRREVEKAQKREIQEKEHEEQIALSHRGVFTQVLESGYRFSLGSLAGGLFSL